MDSDEKELTREEVERILASANMTYEGFEDFINGPGLITVMEENPRFTEELSKMFFKKYPELLSRFASECESNATSEPDLSTEPDPAPDRRETNESEVFLEKNRQQDIERKKEKIKEIANNCDSFAREVFLLKSAKNKLAGIIPHDEIVLYLPYNDWEFIFECVEVEDQKENGDGFKGEPVFQPHKVEKGTTVAAYVAKTGHPVQFSQFSCDGTDCKDETVHCICDKFPLATKRSHSVICQVMTDCDRNLLAVYELRRWKDGQLPPFTEQESIQMLHLLLWDGITIGTALEHEELKKDKEYSAILFAFEEELLQQMNLLWYKVGKLKKVLQQLLPRVMHAKTADDDEMLNCMRNSLEVETGKSADSTDWNPLDWNPQASAMTQFSVATTTVTASPSTVREDAAAMDLFLRPLRPEFCGAEYDTTLNTNLDRGSSDNLNTHSSQHSDDDIFQHHHTITSEEDIYNTYGGSSNFGLERMIGGLNLHSPEAERRSEPSFVELALRTWPIGTGISGAAAVNKKIYNVPDVKKHPNYNNDIDNLNTSLDIKSQLSVPVFMQQLGISESPSQERVCAVITLVSEVEGLFCRREVELVESLAKCCGYAFVQGQQFEKFHKAEWQRIVMMELLAAHSEPTADDLNQLKGLLENLEVPKNMEDLDFCGWNSHRLHKVALLIHMFNELFSARFDYDRDILAKFFLVVAINYRNEVPYHNFNHAFEVTQKIYAILKRLKHGFTLLESVAMFIAAICHDLDHRGLTNKFNNDQQTLLANLYASATMEHHHFVFAVGILTHRSTNFLVNWPPSMYQELIRLIKYNILDTDLPTGCRRITELKTIYPGEDPIQFEWESKEKRQLLMGITLGIADFHMSYLSWDDYRVILELLLQEFWAQGDLEKSLGKEVERFLDRKACSEVPELQIGFLTNLAIPKAALFTRIFPEAQILVENGEAIIKSWKESDDLPDFSWSPELERTRSQHQSSFQSQTSCWRVDADIRRKLTEMNLRVPSPQGRESKNKLSSWSCPRYMPSPPLRDQEEEDTD